jgi:hypothetical protein
MPVDANRVQSVFLMAVEAADPAHQAAILDRERASDTDLGEPNYGLAIAPVSDRSVDEGILTRFQMFSSKHPRAQYTRKLTVQVSQ